ACDPPRVPRGHVLGREGLEVPAHAQPPRAAEREEDPFFLGLASRERADVRARQLARFHAMEPPLDVFVVSPPRASIEGVRSGAEPEIRTPHPVAFVVARVNAGK